MKLKIIEIFKEKIEIKKVDKETKNLVKAKEEEEIEVSIKEVKKENKSKISKKINKSLQLKKLFKNSL